MLFDERHEDWDETPVRCVECGGWNSPSDGDFTYRPGGPVCGFCDHPELIEAA